MSVKKLSETEQEVVHQCIRAVNSGKLIDDREFHARLGFDRSELNDILDKWPLIEDSDDNSTAALVVNNCLNEVSYGCDISPSEWANWFKVSRDEVKRLFERWARLRGWRSTGIR